MKRILRTDLTPDANGKIIAGQINDNLSNQVY